MFTNSESEKLCLLGKRKRHADQINTNTEFENLVKQIQIESVSAAILPQPVSMHSPILGDQITENIEISGEILSSMVVENRRDSFHENTNQESYLNDEIINSENKNFAGATNRSNENLEATNYDDENNSISGNFRYSFLI